MMSKMTMLFSDFVMISRDWLDHGHFSSLISCGFVSPGSCACWNGRTLSTLESLRRLGNGRDNKMKQQSSQNDGNIEVMMQFGSHGNELFNLRQ